MTAAHVFWLFAIALTIGAMLNVLQPILAATGHGKNIAGGVPFWMLSVVPLIAFATYFAVGRPDLITTQADARTVEVQHSASMPDLIRRLETTVQDKPDDAATMVLLARAYYASTRIEQAVPAFERAFALKPPQAAALADYADALTALKGGAFNVPAQQAVERALALDAQHVKSLWLAGSFAFNDRRPADALAYWTRLLPLLPPGSEELRRLQAGMDDARTALVSPAIAAQMTLGASAVGDSKRQISGVVTISHELKNTLRSSDTLYVFARAVQGAPMPLAVFKTTAASWPVAFTLDESMAVMGGTRLGDLKNAAVVARISRSGQAIGASGDLESKAINVEIGAAGVRITIDAIRK